MDFIVYKNRARIKRGILTSFDELPEDKKIIFKKIKNYLVENLDKNVNVSIFGSFRHGIWDEYSDYDIKVNVGGDYQKISNQINEKLNIKVDISYQTTNLDLIIIP